MIKPLVVLQNENVQIGLCWGYFLLAAVLYIVGRARGDKKVKDAGKWMGIGGVTCFVTVLVVCMTLLAFGYK